MELFLICGPKCCGKSTVSRRLSVKLHYRLLDDNYMTYIFRDENKTKGRSIQYSLLKYIGEDGATRGAVYAMDWNFNDEDDCEKAKSICELCKNSGWGIHIIFLDVEYKITLRNQVNRTNDDDVCDGEVKEMTDYFFSTVNSYRALPQNDEMQTYCDDYMIIEISELSIPDVVSTIMKIINEKKRAKRVL